MKRKIALLLAVLMTVALLPAQLVSAASTDYYPENRAYPSRDHTVYIEQRAVYNSTTIGNNTFVGPMSGGLNYVRMAPEISVYVSEIERGDTFQITLNGGSFVTDNGQWWIPNNFKAGHDLWDTENGRWVDSVGALDSIGFYFRKGTWDSNLAGTDWTWLLGGDARNPYVTASGHGPMTSTSLHRWINTGAANNGTYLNDGFSDSRYSNRLYKGTAQLPYAMEIVSPTRAFVTVLQTAKDEKLYTGGGNRTTDLHEQIGTYTKQAVMIIPLPIYSGDENATITASISPVNFATPRRVITKFTPSPALPLLHSAGAKSVTITTAPQLFTSNDKSNYELFPIEEIKITETVAGSIKLSHGIFTVTTREGFEFISPVEYGDSYRPLTGPSQPAYQSFEFNDGEYRLDKQSRRYPSVSYEADTDTSVLAAYENGGLDTESFLDLIGSYHTSGGYMIVWSTSALRGYELDGDGDLVVNPDGTVNPVYGGAFVDWDDDAYLISAYWAEYYGINGYSASNRAPARGLTGKNLTDYYRQDQAHMAALIPIARDVLYEWYFITYNENIDTSTLGSWLSDYFNTVLGIYNWNLDYQNNRATAVTGRYYLPTSSLRYSYGGGLFPNNSTFAVTYMWFELNRNGEIDFSRVFIEYDNLKLSTEHPGVLQINNLPLVVRADTNAPYDDVVVDFAAYNDCGISGSVKIADRLKYGISFTATTQPLPSLYNGQYAVAADGKWTDGWHKVSVMKFRENVAESWNANKETILRFPPQVKVGRVRISSNYDNHIAELGDWTSSSWGVDGPYNYPRTPYDYRARFTGKQTYNDPYIGDAYWAGYIAIKNFAESNEQYNDIILSGLTLEKTDRKLRGQLDFEVWVSVESGFVGDIAVELLGSAIVEEVTSSPLVVATVKNPIEIVPDAITPLKVGYQTQAAADFEIVENRAGILRKNDTLRLSLTDDVNVSDMSFVNAKYAVTNGNIQFKNYRVAGYADSKANSPFLGQNVGGTISMDIAVPSGVASTIRYSDVQVKIDRSAPESNTLVDNQIGYNIVAWGNAVAPNFDATERPRPATFKTPGIKKKYLTVGTLGSGGAMNNKVRVPIGESYIEINGQQYDMDASAYIDADTERTMIPIRYAALALMDDPSILSSRPDAFEDESMPLSWDDATHTVTLFANTVGGTPSVVQFTDGSEFMLVNGVQVPLEAKAVINPEDSRMYIPFRALGYAFNIPVNFQDGEDGKFATFN